MRDIGKGSETTDIEHILNIFSDVRTRVVVALRQLAAALAGHCAAGREAGESLVGGLNVVREVLSVRSVWSRWTAEMHTSVVGLLVYRMGSVIVSNERSQNCGLLTHAAVKYDVSDAVREH